MKSSSLQKNIFNVKQKKLKQAFQCMQNGYSNKIITDNSDLKNIFVILKEGNFSEYPTLIRLIRKVIQSDFYQKHKADESMAEVQFLHDIVMASYIGSDFLPLYKPFACKCERLSSDDLMHTRNELFSLGAFLHDRSLSYCRMHFKELFYAFLSTFWAGPLTLIKKYDPRLDFCNLPGTLFSEELVKNGEKVFCTTLYMPSPTLGNKVSPEMHAFLQALENRKTHTLSYVNLQDITSLDEGSRAKKIMELQAIYPTVFSACSISQDKGFYTYLPKTKKEMLSILFDTKSGYFFPGDSAQYIAPFSQIIDTAFEYTSDTFARYELIHLAIARFFHLKNIKTGSSALFATSCKESIDRGGKMNALLYAACADDVKAEDAALLFHARALTVRSRLMQKRRFNEALRLLEFVSIDKLKVFLEKIS